MSVQVSYRKQIIFYIILILLVFVVTEITFRIYDPTLDFCRFEDPTIDQATRVLICREHNAVEFDNELMEIRGIGVIQHQSEEVMRINNFGFRGVDFNQNKTEGDIRIIAVGGSTTFGSGVINNSTYPVQLQNLINNNSSLNVEVINLGASGFWSYDEVRLINQKAIDLEPDMIIVFDGWNDVIASTLEEEIKETSESRTRFLYIDNSIADFLRNFQSLTSINRVVNYGDDLFGFYNKTIVNYDFSNSDKKIDEWESRWVKTCTSLKEKDIEIIIIIQPLVGTGEKNLTTYEQLWHTRYNGEGINIILEKYVDRLPLLNEYCSGAVDFRTIYDDVEVSIYLDNGHVNKLGTKILAEKIYELILPNIQSIKNEN